ncbi:hypothetical protein FC17_GL000540 [Secundilactobacillus paracollinoides DSM 15502 = JCM 11969]|nr:hypothetical protein FC17_GL000540 [Secundilactobacillus paracollinoides DSM 15502 = JCM 11969]
MIGTLYMTNSINADWTKMYLPFNLSMYIMLISIAGLYFMQFKRTDGGAAIARYAYRVITIVASIYLLIIILAWWLTFPMVMNLDVIAVAAGVVLPIVIKVDFDNKVVSFPHLVERFESLAIIMFGETVVSMADYFELNQFSLIPMVVFLSVMMLFGSYVLQIHYVIEHRQSTRGLVLMYSHFLIVISLNMLTAALTAIREELDSFWLIFIITSLVIFYLPLSANSIYEKERYSLRVSGFLIKGTILIVGGLAWLLMPINLGTATGILLVVTASIFAYDFYQYQHQLRQISE